MNKQSLITGAKGHDGAYIEEFLLNKDYEVHGIKRRFVFAAITFSQNPTYIGLS